MSNYEIMMNGNDFWDVFQNQGKIKNMILKHVPEIINF